MAEYPTVCPHLPNVKKLFACDVRTYLRTGLDKAIGVATPNALIRCCIVGVADVIRIAVPGWFAFDPPIIWSGDIASGLYPRVTSRPLLLRNHPIHPEMEEKNRLQRELFLLVGYCFSWMQTKFKLENQVFVQKCKLKFYL